MRALLPILLSLGLGACDDVSMAHQKKDRAYAPPSVWSNGASARPLPEGTVARGDLARDNATNVPPIVTLRLACAGQQRYQIFCTPCHGLTGEGDGSCKARVSGAAVVRSGAPPPGLRPTFFRRDFGGLWPHVSLRFARAAADRWSIVAYLRALQLAGQAPVGAIPEAARSCDERRGDRIRPPSRPTPIIIGAVGCALLAVWGIFVPRGVLQGWLIAFVIVGGLPLGALALLCVARLTGGRWTISRGSRFCLYAVAATPFFSWLFCRCCSALA